MNYLYRNISPRQLLLLGVIVPLVLTSLVGWLICKSVDDMLSSRVLARHSRQVQAALADFSLALVRAESAQRGYILTHNEAYLEPYHKAIDSAFVQYKILRLLTADNALQQQQLDTLEPLLNAKARLMSQNISMEISGDHAGAVQLVVTDVGRKTMVDIMAAVDFMKTVEVNVLFQRQSMYQHNFKLNTLATGMDMVFILVFMIIILWLIRKLQRLQEAVTFCALTEMIEYEGGLLTIEEYLRRRKDALAKHGLAQIEAERLLGMLDKSKLGLKE